MFKHARARQQSGGGEAARAGRGTGGPPGSTRAQCRRQVDTPPARAPQDRTARRPRARAAPARRPCTAEVPHRAASCAPAAMRRAGTAREPQPAAAPRSAGPPRAHTMRAGRGARARAGEAPCAETRRSRGFRVRQPATPLYAGRCEPPARGTAGAGAGATSGVTGSRSPSRTRRPTRQAPAGPPSPGKGRLVTRGGTKPPEASGGGASTETSVSRPARADTCPRGPARTRTRLTDTVVPGATPCGSSVTAGSKKTSTCPVTCAAARRPASRPVCAASRASRSRMQWSIGGPLPFEPLPSAARSGRAPTHSTTPRSEAGRRDASPPAHAARNSSTPAGCRADPHRSAAGGSGGPAGAGRTAAPFPAQKTKKHNGRFSLKNVPEPSCPFPPPSCWGTASDRAGAGKGSGGGRSRGARTLQPNLPRGTLATRPLHRARRRVCAIAVHPADYLQGRTDLPPSPQD